MAALAVGTTLMTGCAKKSTEWVMAKQATTTPILDRPAAPNWVRGPNSTVGTTNLLRGSK